MSLKTHWTLAIAVVLVVVVCGAPLVAGSRNDAPPLGPKVVTQLPITPDAPPANDNFANATTIDPIPFSDALSTAEATDEAGEPDSSCTLAGNGVWYAYTNAGAYAQTVSANTFASDFDTVLDVYTGTWGALTEIACSDDAGGTTGYQSAVAFDVQPGETAYVRAGGFDGSTGNLVFDVLSAADHVCADIPIGGTLGSGSPDYPYETGSQTGRLYRDGITPGCADTKTCAIFDPAGSRVWDSYTFPNNSEDVQCVTVSYTADGASCGSSGVFGVAYLNSFDPANLCTNYITDTGSSSIGPGGDPVAMSFELAPGDSAVVVIHEVDPGTDLGCTYSLTFVGNTCAPAVPVALEIPTLGRYGLAALAVLMLGGAVVFLRRRRHA